MTEDQYEGLMFEIKDIGRSVRAISIIVQIGTAIAVVVVLVAAFLTLRSL